MAVPISALCISAITEGEIAYGLAKRPDAKRLHRITAEILKRVDVLPWGREAAAEYGRLRAMMQRGGLVLGALDLLIAAHAVSEGAVLVSNNRAVGMVAGLVVEDWTAAP